MKKWINKVLIDSLFNSSLWVTGSLGSGNQSNQMAMLCGLPDTKQDYMTKNRFSEGNICLI